jgi:hypothetical protein
MSYEHCFKCDALTGRAGRHDDSLYCDDGSGPYCESCYHATAEYKNYVIDDLKSRIAQLETENQRLRLLLDTSKSVEREHILEAENAALREQQRWVPVSERLPKETKRYELVCRGANDRWVEERVFLKTKWVVSRHPVEYWREKQPLPASPQEQSE